MLSCRLGSGPRRSSIEQHAVSALSPGRGAGAPLPPTPCFSPEPYQRDRPLQSTVVEVPRRPAVPAPARVTQDPSVLTGDRRNGMGNADFNRRPGPDSPSAARYDSRRPANPPRILRLNWFQVRRDGRWRVRENDKASKPTSRQVAPEPANEPHIRTAAVGDRADRPRPPDVALGPSALHPAAMTSISTSQSLTSVCATIAVVGTTRPPRAATRAAAFASAYEASRR